MEVPAFTCIELDSPQGINALGNIFINRRTTTLFDEFRYFTGVGNNFRFYNSLVEKLTLPEGTITALNDNVMYNCPLSQSSYFYIPEGCETFGNHALGGTPCMIVTLDLPSTTKTFQRYFMYVAPKIQSIILRASTPPEVNSATLPGIPSRVQFYVPDSAVQDYLSDSSWGAYSSRIHPLSEYDG